LNSEELNDLAGTIIGTIGGLTIRVESIDADGRIHAVIAVESVNKELNPGDLIRTDRLQYYAIESIEPNEDPGYLNVILVLTNLK